MIQKQRPTGNYTMIGNDALRDTRLDLTDRGLLATLMSLPETWNFSIIGLMKILPDGRDRIRNSLNRLQKYGYLEITSGRNSKGRFTGKLVRIKNRPESPQTENPTPDKPTADSPPADKPPAVFQPQYKKDKYKNTTMINNNHIRAKNSFQDFEQRSYSPEFYEKLEKKMSGIRPETTG